MSDTEDHMIKNDMELSKMYVPDIPKDIIFPEELNAYLREQIQYLTYENGMLKKNSSENELKLKQSATQIENLSKDLQQYEDESSNVFSSVSSVASAKIVQLSKKLREKSSEVESLKTKCSRLEHQIFQLKQKEENQQTDMVPTKEIPINKLEEQVKQLQEKLHSTTSKLFDCRNSNFQLKNDIKVANKLLQQEVGDNFDNLQVANNGSNNWRGRAQIICDLQQKNAELKEKLKQYQAPKSEIPTQSKNDRRLEITTKENTNLKSEISDLKKKLEGARARCKIFDSECSVLRAKMSVLNEQKETDRHMLSSLTTKLSNVKNDENEELKRKDQFVQKLQNDYKNLQLECTKQKCICENMEKKLKEKDLEIKDLNKKHGFTSPVQVKDDRIVNCLEAEKLRLLELTEIVNKRLYDERTAFTNLQMQFKSERQKTAKLEAKLARMELEHSEKNSVYSLHSSHKTHQSDSSSEDRLELAEENIKALKTRLEIEQRERQLDFQEFAEILKNTLNVVEK